ncbi:MAG: methionyl-tRNA formyltransferase [Planctomycetes bacterium]|nr:methionyl-tRNA formyltransferase [Planctomycetota bacterium]
MRVVFFGSPPFAVPVLARLLDSPHEVLALVTQPDRPSGRGMKVLPSPLVDLARARGLPVLQPQSTRDPAFAKELTALGGDVMIVASYGEIVRQEILSACPQGALNVHASLLPRHRGASPIQAAILAGDAETGVSVQRMVLRLDAGDVLVEERTPIGAQETSGELLARLAVLGGEAALRAIEALAGGKPRFTPQDESEATYARKITKQQGRIDWARDARELERLVRASNPWPLARCSDSRGGDLALLTARVVQTDPGAAPGTLLASKEGPRVACGAGALELVRVKPAGKGEMDGASWLRGARLEPGARLATD